VNNLFNFNMILAWKVHRALISAKLELYLGFLLSLQFGKPSLVCARALFVKFLRDEAEVWVPRIPSLS
jgi:hypothetical protein